MNNASLGRLFDPPLTGQQVGRLRRRGMPGDLAGATAWRERHLDPRHVKAARAGSDAPAPDPVTAPAAPAGPSYADARRRREAAEAEKAELELGLLRGRLCEVESAERAARHGAAVVLQVWDQYVYRCAAELGPGARAVLLREADRARRDIAAEVAKWPDLHRAAAEGKRTGATR